MRQQTASSCQVSVCYQQPMLLLQTFRRAETTFVNINEIDNLTLIMPSQKSTISSPKLETMSSSDKKTKKKGRRKGMVCLVCRFNHDAITFTFTQL